MTEQANGPVGWRDRAAAALLLAVTYLGSVVLANYLTSHYGLITVFPGLLTTAGTVAIGGAILVRDLLQDAAGRFGVVLLILVAALLSFTVAAPRIATASGVTFLVAEAVEFAIYSPLRARARLGDLRWVRAVLVANVAGALVDTFLFLHLAGFPTSTEVVAGQLVGKLYVTVAVVTVGLGARRALLRQPVHAQGA